MNCFSFRHIKRSLSYVPALLMGLVLTACNLVGEPDLSCVEPDDDITISFRVFTGKNSTTRAVDFYGNSAENYIDLSNFKILIFDESQTLKQVLYDNGTLASNTTLTQLGPGFYHIKTKLDGNLYSLSSKFAIVALANWKSEDPRLVTDFKGHPLDMSEIGTLTIADLKEMTFTINPEGAEGTQQESWMPGDNNSWIPMFGSSYTTLESYNDTQHNSGNPMPVPDVNLVRALTKIEIINNDTESGPELQGIFLTQRNRNGLLVQDFDYTGQTLNVLSPTIPADQGYTNSTLRFRSNAEGNKFSAYIPETLLNSTTERRAIRVNISMNGEEQAKWIYLAPYVNGSPVIQETYGFDWENIKRNYYYQYEINSLSFEFVIDVVPWVFGGKVHIDSDDIEEIPD